MHLLTYERQAHRTKDDRKMQHELLNNELLMSYLKRFTYELNVGLYEDVLVVSVVLFLLRVLVVMINSVSCCSTLMGTSIYTVFSFDVCMCVIVCVCVLPTGF